MRMLNDLTTLNDSNREQHVTSNVLEDMTSTMSGALPNSMEALGGSGGVKAGQGTSNNFKPTGLGMYIAPKQSNINEAVMVADDQPHSAYANAPDFSKQLSLRTSMSSNDYTSDPYWQTADRGADLIDSAMELCDTPDSAGLGTEKVMSYLAQPSKPRGISKQPVRPVRPHIPALKTALKRIDRLTAQVEELRAKIKGLRLDNRSLQTKIGELKSEKETLLDTLDQIRMEVDMWDPIDGEAPEFDECVVSLNKSMREIKLLLPPN